MTGQLIIIILLTSLNAFFASAEMALVSLDKNRIKKQAQSNHPKAQLLLKLLDEPSKFLATIQVGITLAGFFSSASAATGISGDFALFLERLNIPYSEQIAIILITIALSYVMLVFGELLPKRLALQKAESIAMRTVRPIHFISKLTKPFVHLLSASTNLLIKMFGLEKEADKDEVTEEEIRLMLEIGGEHGTINQTERQRINSIFEFDDKLAKEVMVARPDVYLIHVKTPVKDILDEYMIEKYSRVPIYSDYKDNIVGILLLKDFFAAVIEQGLDNVKIETIMRPPFFILETKPIDVLFIEMQRTKNHMAVLIDEYGGFSGIVTIEDLIEEVFGDINDEFDKDYVQLIQQIDDITYETNGLVPLNTINEYLHLNLDTSHADTLNGFIIHELGKIPCTGDELNIEHDRITFKMEKVKGRRIEKVLLTIKSTNNNGYH